MIIPKFKFDITSADEASLDDLSKEKILELLTKAGKNPKTNFVR